MSLEIVFKLSLNPLAPILGGIKGIGGHPPTLGKGALPLCMPSIGGTGKAFPRYADTPRLQAGCGPSSEPAILPNLPFGWQEG
jgi:hypothetical protein